MANRVTQTPVEVLESTTSNVRVTQTPLEALETVTDSKVRVSQTPLETLESVATSKVRATQVVIEALFPSVVVYNRTATDTTTISDAATRVLTLARTATDSTSLTDSATRGAAVRTATDTLQTSDSIFAISGNTLRTATDTTSISDTLVRAPYVYPRVCVDTVRGVDSLVYADIQPVASFSASVVSGSEPLRVLFVDTSTNHPDSWLWDFGDGNTSTEQNPYHIFAAGTYTVSLTVTNDGGSDTFTVTAMITVTALSPGVGANVAAPPVSTEIEVDGVDITADVRFADAVFASSVNGSIGQCKFAVRDRGHTYDFVTGKVINLRLDGELWWSGFVERIRRQYSFDVDNTQSPDTVVRWLVIEGYDVNALLSKRVAWNIANPTRVMTPPQGQADPTKPDMWAAGVSSKDVVKFVIANYTVLPADGVTTYEVLDIGSPNPDTAGAYGGGITVLNFLQLVNSLLNGIFYLRPNRSLVFRDVEAATTPFILTDKPDGPYDVGPRDYAGTSDAAKMVNDALVWGTAKGADSIVFAREESAASILEHGRWQSGEFTATLYKQASVDHRADALVNGNSPTRHGAKEDRIAYEATVFRPIFMLGDVVRVEQRVFDGTQTAPFNTGEDFVAINLPVRTMEITWPTKTNPQFRMLLSQELDEPWNTYEFFFPPFVIPPITIPSIPPPTVPFDQQTAHAFFGTFTMGVVDAHGSGYGDNVVGDGTTIFSDNENPYDFVLGQQYVAAMGLITFASDYAPNLGFVTAISTPIFPIIDNGVIGAQIFGVSGVWGFAGTFTSQLTGPGFAAAYVAKGGPAPFMPPIADHTANVTWWVDPVGWVPTNAPVAGQDVINDWQFAFAGQTNYFTTYPYAPGSLVIVVKLANGTEITVAVVEVDPSTGEFSIPAQPEGAQIFASYTIPGSSSYYGPVIEQATRIDATHYAVSYAIATSSQRVWVNGYLQRSGIARDYTITPPNIIVFADPIDDSTTWVWCAYDANGAI